VRRSTILLAASLLLAGCGGGGDGQGPAADGAGTATATVACGGSTYDPAALDDVQPISSLPDGPAGAVDDAGAPAFDPAQDWRVVRQTEDRVDLVRELEEPLDHGDGDVRTHEARTLERITGTTNVPDGTWLLTSAGPCTQRVTDDDLGAADLTLARTPSSEETTIALLVHERACASGQSAEGRVELLGLVETDEQVRLRVGVRPLDGAQDCQGNPPTPFTVELEEPLGERAVVDTAVVPPRPVTAEDR
jgi:hypothetical protein